MNKISNKRKAILSYLSILFFSPVNAAIHIIIALKNSTEKSTISIEDIDIGQIIEETPKTISILNILEPNIFPRARAPFFFLAATMQVANSGREVPPARMVTAMNLSLTPIYFAIFIAESTKSCPPKIRAASPPIIKMTAKSELYLNFI